MSMRSFVSMSRAAALLVLASAMPVSAAEYLYDGSTAPTPVSSGNSWVYVKDPSQSQRVFEGVFFQGSPPTSFSTNGYTLTLTTRPVQGIWLGNGHPGAPSSSSPSWNISSNAVGNYAGVRAFLGSGSIEWHMYLQDGVRQAIYQFDANQVSYWTAAGKVDRLIDATVFHTYEFYLIGSRVDYVIDGQVVYSGQASATSATPLLIVGDGSGSTPTGIGSMTIDWLKADTTPTFPIPEPASLGIFALGLMLMARRR